MRTLPEEIDLERVSAIPIRAPVRTSLGYCASLYLGYSSFSFFFSSFFCILFIFFFNFFFHSFRQMWAQMKSVDSNFKWPRLFIEQAEDSIYNGAVAKNSTILCGLWN